MAQARFNAYERAESIIPTLNEEISEKFQLLMETKHLYQKVTIDWDKVVAGLKESIVSAFRSEFDGYLRNVPYMPFTPVTQVRLLDQAQGVLGRVPLVLRLKNVTLFCRKCDRRCTAAYSADEIDILAAYIVPLDLWYIIPVKAFAPRKCLRFYPGGGGMFEKYSEAWWRMGAKVS